MASFYYIDGVHNASVERLTYLEEPQILSHKCTTRCLKALIENCLEFDGCIIFVLLVTFEIFKFFGYGIKVNKSIFFVNLTYTLCRGCYLSL
jgi:hypothetical protein